MNQSSEQNTFVILQRPTYKNKFGVNRRMKTPYFALKNIFTPNWYANNQHLVKKQYYSKAYN